MGAKDLFAAQVVARSSATDKELSDIKSEFAAMGFDTGSSLGNSFSIAAPVDKFMSVLGDNTVMSSSLNNDSSFDDWVASSQQRGTLSSARLPETLRDRIADIVVTNRPAFGP